MPETRGFGSGPGWLLICPDQLCDIRTPQKKTTTTKATIQQQQKQKSLRNKITAGLWARHLWIASVPSKKKKRKEICQGSWEINFEIRRFKLKIRHGKKNIINGGSISI